MWALGVSAVCFPKVKSHAGHAGQMCSSFVERINPWLGVGSGWGQLEHHFPRLHLEWEPLANPSTGSRSPFSCPAPTPLTPPWPPAPLCPCEHVHMCTCGLLVFGREWGWVVGRQSPSVILFPWFSFQAVTVNLFYVSLCESVCRIKPFTNV